MHSFGLDSVEAEKANAMLSYCSMRNVSKLFRLAELFLALLLFFWIVAQLPFAIQISGEFFRKISTVIVSHAFVFIFCNAIIVTLFFKFSQFSDRNSAVYNAEADVYAELVTKSGNNRPKLRSEDPPLSQEPEVVVYEDKRMICAANTRPPTPACEKAVPTVTDSETNSYRKVYTWSQSEKLNRDRAKKSRRVLQRSDTEKCQQIVTTRDNPAKPWFPEDELSNEEFRRIIEAFIAKELTFRRQESLAIVFQERS